MSKNNNISGQISTINLRGSVTGGPELTIEIVHKSGNVTRAYSEDREFINSLTALFLIPGDSVVIDAEENPYRLNNLEIKGLKTVHGDLSIGTLYDENQTEEMPRYFTDINEENVEFLGSFSDDKQRYDIYLERSDVENGVIARFGNEDHEYKYYDEQALNFISRNKPNDLIIDIMTKLRTHNLMNSKGEILDKGASKTKTFKRTLDSDSSNSLTL